jgi:hypothetical protein
MTDRLNQAFFRRHRLAADFSSWDLPWRFATYLNGCVLSALSFRGTTTLVQVQSSSMLSRCSRFFIFPLLLLLAACSTAHRGGAPLKAPSPPAQKSTTAPSETAPKLPVGEYTVLIESDPSGAMVVVAGVPIGRTPQRIVLPGTVRGFSRDQVSIKVRFVATESDQTSQTIEEVLTPLDKIPASMRFTTYGTIRVAR